MHSTLETTYIKMASHQDDIQYPNSQDGGELRTVLLLLRQCLFNGECDPVPERLQSNPELNEMLAYLQQIQDHITLLARGEVSTPVSLAGYTGDILKQLQDNLHQVIWKARLLTAGDFSEGAGDMGEVSAAFNVMGKTLQTALARLERQKRDLTELSENLQREIDARIAVEENLRQEQARLQKLAATDPLTGIANRRYFFQLALREIERLRRSRGQACLAMLDLDHFKELNDTLGHGMGDRTLHFIAQLVSNGIRPYDLVGRYGGDEFVFLFPETPLAVAHAILERLRESVEKENIRSGEGNPMITVSIGLTELGGTDMPGTVALEHAIIRADNALYRAKAQSRNVICTA
ncbi:GGDEF domain-containing protein [Desulfovibrio sp. OttesenSCG-928-O18]|nr:GGDEF domain-containing protein [Desulfovibrio sp. OttesenSCG-928-O18]